MAEPCGYRVIVDRISQDYPFYRAYLKNAVLSGTTVINNPFINHVDIETIGAAVKAANGRVVTIEDHQVVGGMGAQVSHALSRAGIAHRMTSLGIPGEFGQSAYLAEELYKLHGLSADKLVAAALALVK